MDILRKCVDFSQYLQKENKHSTNKNIVSFIGNADYFLINTF